MERRASHIRNGQEIIDDARREGHEVIIGNQELPTALFLKDIAQSIYENTFTVVLGETGSGKTTQTPQVIYSMGMTTDHTQPRRSAAHESAKRIQQELAGAIPNLHPQTAAVHTGEECTVTPETQVTVYTDGMLLAVGYNSSTSRLTTHKENNVTIIDEAHEWNKNQEVLVGLLMEEAKVNPDLRVVIMTATPNKDFLMSRIEEVSGIKPNVIEIPGRTYPIEYIERPELTSVSATLELVKPGAGIMVFKQGIGEINDTINDIEHGLPARLREKVRFFKYHSTIPSQKLSEACSFDQGEEYIKIVVGTNAMESSLTIGGIQYVVDDGMSRQVSTDKRGFEGLYSVPISQDRCKQRAGRAGRTSPGVAILTRADAKTPFVPFEDRPEHEVAEILRLDLKNEVLALAVLGIDLLDFETINRVDKLPIIRAKESLTILGALDDDGIITEIGIDMNKYPVRASLKRTIVEAKKYSQDIQVMIAAMAAAVDAGGLPLYNRFASRDWKELSSETSSDLLRQLDLFIEVQSMSKYDQQKIGINSKSVGKAQETYEKLLHQLGITEGTLKHPTELQREEMIKCIYAGHVEHIFQRMGRNTFRLLEDTEATAYKLSDRSVVDPRHPKLVVGVPYIIERTRHGKKEAVPIIEAVTEVSSIDVLGEAAVNMAHWSDEEIVWRGGRVFLQTKQDIKGIRTGIMSEAMGDAADVERRSRELMEYVLENPGPAQRKLRDIKKATEELNRKAINGATRMKQEGFLEFIAMAIKRVDVPDAHYIDNEIMLIIQENDISVNTYISREDEKRILDDAPEQIIVDNEILDVTYRNGVAIVGYYDQALVCRLEQDVYLPDGRNVRFWHNKREWKAMDLKRELLATRGNK